MTARPLPHRRARFAAAVGAAAIALVTACRADLPTSAQVEQMDVHAIEEVAIPKLGIDASNVEYVLDGVLVDRSVVAALPPGKIESIAVVRAEVPRMLVSTKKDGEIPVTTVAPLQFRDVKILYVQEVEAPREKPLFVIDGVIGGDLEMSRLEPDRIETVEVVKGEAARRVYGERAANGVVLVKTWPDGARRPLTRDSVRGTLSPLARPLVIRRDSSSPVNLIRRDSVAPSVRKP